MVRILAGQLHFFLEMLIAWIFIKFNLLEDLKRFDHCCFIM